MLKGLEHSFLKLQFGFKNRSRLYKKLSKFLKNGFAMSKALDTMYNHAKDGGRKTKVDMLVLDDIRRSVANGKGLSPALRKWIPNGERMIIEGGEQAGKLDIALEKAILVSSTAKQIRNTLVGGLIYPAMLVALTIGFMVIFGTQVIPAFEVVLPREQWTGVGYQMAVLSDFIRSWLLPTICVLAVGGTAVGYSVPRWKKGLRTKFDRLPPYSIYRTIQGSGFMLTLSAMLESGISLVRALDVLQREASPWYKERLQKTLRLIDSGNNLGDALYLTGYDFPDRESINDLRAYSEMSNLEEALAILGNEWLIEAVERIKAQTEVLKTLAFFFLGGTFGWIVFGIFSIQSQISNAVN